MDNDHDLASHAMQIIQALYAIEREARQLSPEARQQHRQKLAKPIMKSFKQWLDDQGRKVLPKSPIGDAIQYTLNL